jgi:5-methylcytosine-specific restriction endonuclease McrA
MSTAAAWALILLTPVLGLVGSAFNSPAFGLLPACFTRRARWRYRKLRGERSGQRSGRPGRWLTAMVKRADRHRCVYCGAREGDVQMQVDHIVPWIMGGLTCLWNCALLCRSCNASKSCYWVAPGGHEYYRGRRKPPARAKLILASELIARRGLARWMRAYGLLPSW